MPLYFLYIQQTRMSERVCDAGHLPGMGQPSHPWYAMSSPRESHGVKLSMLSRAGWALSALPSQAQGQQAMHVNSFTAITCSTCLLKVQLVICLVHQPVVHEVSA